MQKKTNLDGFEHHEYARTLSIEKCCRMHQRLKRPSAARVLTQKKSQTKPSVNKVNVQISVNKLNVNVNVNKVNERVSDICSIHSHYKDGGRWPSTDEMPRPLVAEPLLWFPL